MHASVDYTLTKEAIASTLGGFKRKPFLILKHPQFLNQYPAPQPCLQHWKFLAAESKFVRLQNRVR